MALLFGELAFFVHVKMGLGALGNLTVHTGFDGGRIFDGFLAKNSHEVGFLHLWGRRRLETETNFRLLFFEVGHAALAADLGLFRGSEKHWLWCRHVLLLRWF